MSQSRQQKAKKELARRRLHDFTKWTFPQYKTNWHHLKMIEGLEAVERFIDTGGAEGIDRLIIVAPPRHGKSEVVSRRFPAWFLGRHPEMEIIAASYAQDLANRMSRDVQKICRSDAYKALFGDIFGDRVAYEEFELRGGGTYKAAGVSGPITGRGGNLLVVDDPFKNREEAESETNRNKVWDWWQDDFTSRLEWPGAIVLMHTRWHHDDLVGRILNDPEEAALWTVIHLDAIYDWPEGEGPEWDPRSEGDPLWPGRMGNPGEDPEIARARALKDLLHRKKKNAYGFEALYQGRPSIRAGGLYKRKYVEDRYSAPPAYMARHCSPLVISVDATFKDSKKSDKVAMLVAGLHSSGKLVVLDEVFDKMDYPTTKRALRDLAAKWPGATILIEDKANGPALVAELKREIFGIIAIDPGRESKDSRAQRGASAWEAGDVLLPEASLCPWILGWIEDFCGFPSRPYDDRVDAFSQMVIWLDGRRASSQHLRRILHLV